MKKFLLTIATTILALNCLAENTEPHDFSQSSRKEKFIDLDPKNSKSSGLNFHNSDLGPNEVKLTFDIFTFLAASVTAGILADKEKNQGENPKSSADLIIEKSHR